MSRIRTRMMIESDYDNLTTAVSFPFPGKDSVILSKDIHSQQEKFSEKAENAQFDQDKESYGKAALVCKFGEHCGATLKSLCVKEGMIYFVLSFPILEHLIEFEQGASINIDGLVPPEEAVEQTGGIRM